MVNRASAASERSPDGCSDSYVYVWFDSFCFISEKTPSILDGECAQGKKKDCSRLLFHCFSVANQLCFSQNSWGEIKIEALQTIVVLGFVSFNPLKPTLKHSVIWLIVYTFFTQHINLNIFSNILRWTLTGLKQLRLSWLSMHHFFFFRKIMFKCEYQKWSSGFWGTLICSSLNHYCIALHYMFWNYRVLIIKVSIKYHKTFFRDIEWHWYLYAFNVSSLLYC